MSRYARTCQPSPPRSCARSPAQPAVAQASLPTLARSSLTTPHRSHLKIKGLSVLAGGFKTTQLQHQATTTRTTCWLASATKKRLCNQNLGGRPIKADVQHPFAQAGTEARCIGVPFLCQPSLPLLTLRVSPNPQWRNSQPAHPSGCLHWWESRPLLSAKLI